MTCWPCGCRCRWYWQPCASTQVCDFRSCHRKAQDLNLLIVRTWFGRRLAVHHKFRTSTIEDGRSFVSVREDTRFHVQTFNKTNLHPMIFLEINTPAYGKFREPILVGVMSCRSRIKETGYSTNQQAPTRSQSRKTVLVVVPIRDKEEIRLHGT